MWRPQANAAVIASRRAGFRPLINVAMRAKVPTRPGEGKLTFRGTLQGQTVAFVPLSSILHERYFVYHEIQA
jgi:hypothetical protein